MRRAAFAQTCAAAIRPCDACGIERARPNKPSFAFIIRHAMRVDADDGGFQDIVKRKHIRMIPDQMKAAMLSERSGTRSCIPAVNRLDRSVPGYVRSETGLYKCRVWFFWQQKNSLHPPLPRGWMLVDIDNESNQVQ